MPGGHYTTHAFPRSDPVTWSVRTTVEDPQSTGIHNSRLKKCCASYDIFSKVLMALVALVEWHILQTFYYTIVIPLSTVYQEFGSIELRAR